MNDQSRLTLLERDPVTFEVVRSALYSACAEMKAVIMRTSFSPLLSLSADLSCALMDYQGRIVAQGNDIPVHLGAVPYTIRAALAQFPLESWRASDGVLVNDPYSGGTHLPDMSLICPIFAGGSRLMGFSLSRVHWPDVGGIAPGSSSVSDHIIKEGLRVPPLRIIEGGQVRADILALILANVRVPEDRKGDFNAQIAGAERMRLRVLDLVERYGADTVADAMRDTQAYSRRLIESRLAAVPDGIVDHAEPLDGDGVGEATAPMIRVRITKQGSRFKVDFSGSDPCAAGPINAPIAVTASAVFYTVLAFCGGDILPNEGVYQLAEVVAPEGTVVNARYPAPVVAANTETSNRIVDVLLAALAKAYPDKVPGGSYGSACVYTLGGTNPASGRPFVHYETVGGGSGAHPSLDGASGFRVHMGNTMNLPVEAVEAALPVRFIAYEIASGSGGAGRRQGGDGVRKVVEILTDDVAASILGERTNTSAHGVAGGAPGVTARFRLVSASGETRELSAKSGPHRMRRGDRLEMVTAGGGGWGRPGEGEGS
ncbi:hydantoinase B/oxoprolinase family protein [Enterovirga sp. CN4-39]|uniref:hydantoinase B/oxoprolinase family protein n=1 Tax=Enterovirga sp. CN4-39 TaxID=3400910 RepID=UPI003C0EF646